VSTEGVNSSEKSLSGNAQAAVMAVMCVLTTTARRHLNCLGHRVQCLRDDPGPAHEGRVVAFCVMWMETGIRRSLALTGYSDGPLNLSAVLAGRVVAGESAVQVTTLSSIM